MKRKDWITLISAGVVKGALGAPPKSYETETDSGLIQLRIPRHGDLNTMKDGYKRLARAGDNGAQKISCDSEW